MSQAAKQDVALPFLVPWPKKNITERNKWLSVYVH